MRLALSYLVITSLFFSPLAQGQVTAKKQSVRLQDYFINPAVDLSWMTENERAAYVAYLYSLRMLVETELSANMVIVVETQEAKAKTTSKLESLFQLLGPIIKIDQAEAVALTVLRVAGSLIAKAYPKMGSQTAKIASEKAGSTLANSKGALKNRTKNATDVDYRDIPTDGIKSGALASSAKYVSVVAVAASSVMEVATLGDDESVKNLKDSKTAGVVSATDFSDAVSRKMMVKKNEPRDLEPIANREGLFCLFGGHASNYIKRGEKFVCPAPVSTVNNPICKDKSAPSFYCQSMGLSESVKSDEASKKLCISITAGRGLLDLTVRCKEAFIGEFLPHVQSVNPIEIKKLQNEISAGLTALELKKGIADIGFLEYCSGGSNKVNRGRQTKPCQAVLQMVDEIQKYPAIAKGAEISGDASRHEPSKNSNTPAGSTN